MFGAMIFRRDPFFCGHDNYDQVGAHAWMDGWVAGWLVGWLAGWLAGWMDGWIDGWMDGLLVEDRGVGTMQSGSRQGCFPSTHAPNPQPPTPTPNPDPQTQPQLVKIARVLGTDPLHDYLARYGIELDPQLETLLGSHAKKQWTKFVNSDNQHLVRGRAGRAGV